MSNKYVCSICGKTVTISDMCGYNYRIKEDGECCSWTYDMFEEAYLEENNKNNNSNIKEKDMKNFRIKDYKIYEDRAVIVEFEDGTQEKAVCNEDDKFDLEYGVQLCVLKHIFGADEYKSMIKTAMNQIKRINKEKENKKKEEELIARKKAKAARRKARRLERKRKERVEEMKEAYLAAMKEYDGILISDMLEGSFDDMK